MDDIIEICIARCNETHDIEYRKRLTLTELKNMTVDEVTLHLLNCLNKVLYFDGKKRTRV